MSKPKNPYKKNAGYVDSRISNHPKLPGHFVVYDRNKGFDCDADERWIVMHEPSSHHIAVKSLIQAKEIMSEAAKGSDLVDFGQHDQ
jgi:hypothetical protein